MTFNEQYKLMRKQQKAEQTWSAKQAKKQMDFQKMMSDTAHQREMADLKAAGLNPVLTGMGGSGAAAASGASADVQSIASMIPQALAVADDAVKAVSHSARSVKRNDDESQTTVNVNNSSDNSGNDTNLIPISNDAKDLLTNSHFVNTAYNLGKNFVLFEDGHGNNFTAADAIQLMDAGVQDIQEVLGTEQGREFTKMVEKSLRDLDYVQRNTSAKNQQRLFDKTYKELKDNLLNNMSDEARKNLTKYGHYTPYRNMNKRITDIEKRRYRHRGRI